MGRAVLVTGGSATLEELSARSPDLRSRLAERVRNLPSVATAIADSVTEMILSGQLQPGARLVQTDLAELFGVSRVPVRDALQLLQQRQLAVPGPGLGLIVRRVSVALVRHIFAMRRLLEVEAARRAIATVSELDFDRMAQTIERQRAAVKARDLAEARTQDEQFHRMMWQRSGNPLLEQFIEQCWMQMLQARGYAQHTPGWGTRSVTGHELILAALRAGDLAAIERHVADAIDEGEKESLRQIETLEERRPAAAG
jgi:DNA-binding GntR family transcriptional regulator